MDYCLCIYGVVRNIVCETGLVKCSSFAFLVQLIYCVNLLIKPSVIIDSSWNASVEYWCKLLGSLYVLLLLMNVLKLCIFVIFAIYYLVLDLKNYLT